MSNTTRLRRGGGCSCTSVAACLLLLVGVGTAGPAAEAQSLTDRVSDLLTSAVVAPPGDHTAAAATRDTLLGALAADVGVFPLEGSGGGFVYKFNRELAVAERVSEGFGPFFTERTLRNEAGQFSAGATYQAARFSSLQGFDLGDGTFPTTSVRDAAGGQIAVETLRLTLLRRTLAPFFAFGLTDRFTIGATVPVVRVSLDGERSSSTAGDRIRQAQQRGEASGIGDVIGQLRYRVAGAERRGTSIAVDLRLPTGNRQDLVGAGSARARLLAITSLEEGRVGMHLNGGVILGSAIREVLINSAFTVAATQRVTLVGEGVFRIVRAFTGVEQQYQPSTEQPGLETMRWVATDGGNGVSLAVLGVKWNAFDRYVLSANVLIRATDFGLRSRVTPSLSLEYAF